MEKYKSGAILTIMIVSMSVGVLASVAIIAFDDVGALPFLGTIIASGFITLLILGAVSLPFAIKIRAISEAVTAINQGKKANSIEKLPAGVLSTLIAEMNTLIDNQGDFQSMRGRLFRQISEVAAQEERNRLARDLHDSIKQQVFSMSVSAAAAHAHLDSNPTAAREALLDVRQSAQEAMVEMRVLLQQLAPAPLEQLGLIESIRQQMEALSYRTGARIETDFDKLPSDEQLPIGAQETFFRIAQEALSNIARHARAKNVSLSLKLIDDNVRLTIQDDGQGFDTASVKRGMGLTNMERRVADLGGEFELESTIGKGSRLSIAMPLGTENPIEEIKENRKHHKKLAEGVYHQYMGVTGGIAGTIFNAALTIRAFTTDSSDILGYFTGFFILVSIYALRQFWRRYKTKRQDMLDAVPANDPAWELVKQHQHEAHWIIAFAAAFVIPGSLVGIENLLWLPSLIGILLLVIIEWTMFNMLRHQHAYLKKLFPFELIDAMQAYRMTLTAGIAATVLVTLTVVLPGTSTGFYLFPVDREQWDSNFFTAMIVIFAFYHIWSMGLYLHWNNRIKVK